jgi:hypothetical protein
VAKPRHASPHDRTSASAMDAVDAVDDDFRHLFFFFFK